MSIATWNMQGSNASTEAKWNTVVQPILQYVQPTPVVCLQECGGVPDSAKLFKTVKFAISKDITDTVEIYTWGGTQTRPAYYIYFHNWDTEGNRVNSAIVTNVPPAENLQASIALISPQGERVWRPALGVKFGDTWVFSFHAISPGGADGSDLLEAVAASYPTWIVAADWNRQPDKLAVPGGSVICPPNANTYSVKDPKVQYDYCVRSGADVVTGLVIDTVMSDHFPVSFAF